jgi:NADP-dependent 3-hydroxy acid dehydrogenase YdfG
MDLELIGKIAVVTGASKGIGLAVTRELAAEGALVVAGAQAIVVLPASPRTANVTGANRVTDGEMVKTT